MKKVLEKPPAFQFYVKDWLTDWRMMTLDSELKCIYIDLLCLSWLEEDTSLPHDINKLSKICRTSDEKIAEILTLFFTEKDGRIFNKKLRKQKEHIMSVRKERQKSGKKGGQAIPKETLSKVSSKKQAKEDETEVEVEVETGNEKIVINKVEEFKKDFIKKHST